MYLIFRDINYYKYAELKLNSINIWNNIKYMISIVLFNFWTWIYFSHLYSTLKNYYYEKKIITQKLHYSKIEKYKFEYVLSLVIEIAIKYFILLLNSEYSYTNLYVLSIAFRNIGSCKKWPLISFNTLGIIIVTLAFLRYCNASVFLTYGVSSRIRAEKTLMSIMCFLTTTCAYDVVRHGSSSQVRHLCPLKLYVVKSSGRTWSRTSSHEIGVAVV